ncbi:MAG: translational GTPase TypA [Patescibacteria group bacterium]|jgi:GTP-binding protein
MEFRNIAIIAHVDHGKTTLVDAMLKQSGTFNDREVIEECVMDSNELERERGITIYAKNTAIRLGDIKVNIVDTPGHADFSSEVERVLRMVDSVLLIVDASEGPMPQTRYVLRKSLALGLKPIVVINKIDRATANPEKTLNKVFDLFVELGATEEQLDFRYIYCIGKQGIARTSLSDTNTDLKPLFDLILEVVPPAPHNIGAPMRMQTANLAYDNYVGRLAVGRVYEGIIKPGMKVTVITPEGKRSAHAITKLYTHQGLKKFEALQAEAGDIVQIAGIPDIYVGDTIAEDEKAELLPTISIDPPTLEMDFMVNNSLFAGKEGTQVTSRKLRARLLKELETNVGLKVKVPEAGDVFTVSGRGEMHLSILIEQMRREGFELQVGEPRVIMKEENGVKLEPIESVVVDVPDEFVGVVIEKLGKRKGELVNMDNANGSTRLEYLMPTRGLLGFRGEFVTDTKGLGTLARQFAHYAPEKGEIERRNTRSLISGFTGTTMAYALTNLQDRGTLFVGAGVEVYEGMVIGWTMKENMTVNPIREKRQSNMRSSGADIAIKLTPPLDMTLEKALEYITDDELVEVTPKSIRIRKRFLKEHERRSHHELS